LYCLDPPYLQETRTSPEVYSYEMTVEQHAQLLDLIRRVKGKVMLSGYYSKLYEEMLAGWNRYLCDLPNNAAGGETKRTMTEVVWCNF
jgi:DNA adenine methylase